jgi:hypothetical protein
MRQPETPHAQAECRTEHEEGSGAGDGIRTRDILLWKS